MMAGNRPSSTLAARAGLPERSCSPPPWRDASGGARAGPRPECRQTASARTQTVLPWSSRARRACTCPGKGGRQRQRATAVAGAAGAGWLATAGLNGPNAPAGANTPHPSRGHPTSGQLLVCYRCCARARARVCVRACVSGGGAPGAPSARLEGESKNLGGAGGAPDVRSRRRPPRVRAPSAQSAAERRAWPGARGLRRAGFPTRGVQTQRPGAARA